MASRRGSVAMFLVKWLVIPIGLAAIGFFIVGPLLLGTSEKPQEKATPTEQVVEQPTNKPRVGNPEVEVTARPASHRRSSRRSSRRNSEKRNQPAPEIPSPDEEPPRSGPDGG